MESSCPFYPKGKHSTKDYLALKAYVERNSKTPARDQEGTDRNPSQQQVGPAFPDPEHQLNMIYGGVGCIRVQAEAKANRSGDQCSSSGDPQVSPVVGGTNHLRPSGSSGPHSSPRSLPAAAGSHCPDDQTQQSINRRRQRTQHPLRQDPG